MNTFSKYQHISLDACCTAAHYPVEPLWNYCSMPGISVPNSMWTKLTLSLNMTPSELKLRENSWTTFTFLLDVVDYQHGSFCHICNTSVSSDVLLTDFIGLTINVSMIIQGLTCALYFPSLWDLSFILYVNVSYVLCFFPFIIYIFMMCCVCNWPSFCWLSTVINMSRIK